MGDGGNALWRKHCIDKCNILNDGGDIPMVQNRASRIWKSVFGIFNVFSPCLGTEFMEVIGFIYMD